MNTHKIIDLQTYRTPNSRVFTGRDRGIEVREASKIDILEAECETITIAIPDDIGSINPSFLEEFLYNVVIKLQPDIFFKKFKFQNNGRYKINNDLHEAVERIVREENALVHSWPFAQEQNIRLQWFNTTIRVFNVDLKTN